MLTKEIKEYKSMREYIIKQFIKHKDINVVLQKLGIEKYEYLCFLTDLLPEYKDEIISILPMQKFEDERIAFLSDTHIGSIYENVEYLEKFYDFCLEHNITHVIHAGDLLHSNKKDVLKSYRDLIKQTKHMIKIYPYTGEITTHILLGNHDYHAIKKEAEVLDIIKTREDFDILGIKRAYFEFNNELFSVIHKCDKYPLNLPNVDVSANFYGHRHSSKVDGKSVWIPTTSSDIKEYGSKIENAGFLTLEKDDKGISIYDYDYELKYKKLCHK